MLTSKWHQRQLWNEITSIERVQPPMTSSLAGKEYCTHEIKIVMIHTLNSRLINVWKVGALQLRSPLIITYTKGSKRSGKL